jgi:two-component system phosphate regulon response regulator PhoB/two-component system alkaline phosphatase synthesis response regulator PhoP
MIKRVLVLERDRDILEIVTLISNKRRCTVLRFQTEEGVYDKILKLMPDAILLDIVKLSEFGTKLCRNIK